MALYRLARHGSVTLIAGNQQRCYSPGSTWTDCLIMDQVFHVRKTYSVLKIAC